MVNSAKFLIRHDGVGDGRNDNGRIGDGRSAAALGDRECN
jgi:hypothetical protein